MHVASRLDDGASCAASGRRSRSRCSTCSASPPTLRPLLVHLRPVRSLGLRADLLESGARPVGRAADPDRRRDPIPGPGGSSWVLMFYETSTTAGPALGLTRYNPDIPGPDGWEGQPYPLPLPPSWTL